MSAAQTVGPFHVEAGRAIVDSRGRVVGTAHARRKLADHNGTQYESEGGIAPVEADRNAYLLAASWSLREFARAYLAAHDEYRSIIYCDLCHAVTACMADEVSAQYEDERAARAMFIAQAHTFRADHACESLKLVDHARTCLYRMAVEALAEADK